MKRLRVYLNERLVGHLDQDDSGLLIFQYDPQWLQTDGAVPLSRSLPLREEPFRGNAARPFFAGILPEEDSREQIAAILGISARNDFGLLERIGGECAGAVALYPEDMPKPSAKATGLRQLSEKELQQIILELPRRPLLAGREGLRLSLAGAQSKLPVVVHGSGIALPLGDTPSTHIIKPEPERFPGLVANEALCMTLARAVGLNVASIFTRRVGDKPCLFIERYDRDDDQEGRVTRIHQEDFCQALGFPPEKKYQQEGGPLLRDCVALLREWSTAPAVDIRDFLDGLIFQVLIGDADAHAKNFSLLYRGNQRRLAPLYDLVCTLAWPELSKTPAMKIGGSPAIQNITAKHWRKLAEESRLSWPGLRERITALCEKTLAELRNIDLSQVAGDPDMVRRVAAIIEAQAKSLMAMLK